MYEKNNNFLSRLSDPSLFEVLKNRQPTGCLSRKEFI